MTGQARPEKGGFVFATRKGLYLWDERTGESQFILDPEAGNAPVRFNDGSADRMGRFWAAPRTPTTSPGPKARSTG